MTSLKTHSSTLGNHTLTILMVTVSVEFTAAGGNGGEPAPSASSVSLKARTEELRESQDSQAAALPAPSSGMAAGVETMMSGLQSVVQSMQPSNSTSEQMQA